MKWKAFSRKRPWSSSILSWNLPGHTEKNHENMSNWADSLPKFKRTILENKFRAFKYAIQLGNICFKER
jgi:hypothetical protein